MTTTAKIAAAFTIRGVGKDTANAVNATQDAGRSVGHAARK
ncbi:putative small secreted protein [Rhizobium pisi]|uniref:Entericidin A/B family lipoprotein n=1 Tax=Rhizobium pisi TaxID=574561 RepID=A0A427MF59_9HYPH|nr:entericidin A/B family lipoprotein [Rhizobium pisi]MBB3137340.1 putative small secreted protein [Rhizobium pisi]RSB66534.1 entericidin A/B family lipoprotein [Rhizobium pisi]